MTYIIEAISDRYYQLFGFFFGFVKNIQKSPIICEIKPVLTVSLVRLLFLVQSKLGWNYTVLWWNSITKYVLSDSHTNSGRKPLSFRNAEITRNPWNRSIFKWSRFISKWSWTIPGISGYFTSVNRSSIRVFSKSLTIIPKLQSYHEVLW